jgi:hypothetical protein
MSANKMSPKATSRMNRIKYLSHFLKAVLLSYFVVIGLLFAYARGVQSMSGLSADPFNSFLDAPAKSKIFTALGSALFLLAVMASYRLLDLYEKGIIFSKGNASQIRRLGCLAIAYGLLNACSPVFQPNHGVFAVVATLMNFLLSPWFFGGCFTIIITWIMDEGRKIQEEQELTV